MRNVSGGEDLYSCTEGCALTSLARNKGGSLTGGSSSFA